MADIHIDLLLVFFSFVFGCYSAKMYIGKKAAKRARKDAVVAIEEVKHET